MDKRYAIWLVPKGETYKRLERVILDLSKAYSTIDFEPHITLIAKLTGDEKELAANAKRLSESSGPFKISLNGAKYSDDPYRSVFLDIKENKELIGLNRKARKFFEQEGYSDYQPHLSILYVLEGNVDKETKKKVCERIGNSLDFTFEADELHLMLTAQHPAKKLKSFRMSRP